MSRYREAALAGAAAFLLASPAVSEPDVAAGEQVFAQCKACHAVGEGAANKMGPQLNELLGRTAGSLPGFNYSPALVAAGEEGLVWDKATLQEFLADPRGYISGNRMAFAGLRGDEELADVIAYLATFSGQEDEATQAEPAEATAAAQSEEPRRMQDAGEPAPAPSAGLHFGLGRLATEEEVAAWDIDVRPDGLGLPEGRGTVADGEVIYDRSCAFCHGDFGEAIDRWPVLAGGQGSLTAERPEKTVGSYWPYLSTVYDYVRRAMPFGDARSLTDDEVYAVTAYILYLNDVVTDEDFELTRENFTSIRLPNEESFIDDDREAEPHYADKGEPCMSDCIPGSATIKMHAAVLNVTPGDGTPAAGTE